MTFSIIALDPVTGAMGGAAATANLAVGVFVLHLSPDCGAIATQGFSTNYYYGPHGLQMLAEGHTAQQTVTSLTTADDGRARRQVIVLDAAGRTAGWTGQDNHGEMGLRLAQGLAVAGNYLSDQSVLDAMQQAYGDCAGKPLAERLLAALRAGQKRGGDRRGTSSAALRILRSGRLPFDLRVDDEASPIERLEALYERSQDPAYQAFLDRLPTPANPHRA